VTQHQPTLTPHFREFLPVWLADQPWYLGSDVPAMSAVGFFRLEDPAGEVGMETHLVMAGSAVYQIPMTFRAAPLSHLADGSETALMATAEHSELGTRWIYDATFDPAWAAAVVKLIADEASAATRSSDLFGAADVRGVRRGVWPPQLEPCITVNRVLEPGPEATGPDVLGAVMGSWYPAGPATPVVNGCLAVLRG
jgi:hypothetical protein